MHLQKAFFLSGKGENMKAKYKFMEFHLGRREAKKRPHPSTQLFNKFKKKPKIKTVMARSKLLKFITKAYTELIEFRKS